MTQIENNDGLNWWIQLDSISRNLGFYIASLCLVDFAKGKVLIRRFNAYLCVGATGSWRLQHKTVHVKVPGKQQLHKLVPLLLCIFTLCIDRRTLEYAAITDAS